MRRRTVLVPTAIIATAALVACLAASLAVSGKADAAYPGENGEIVFTSFRDWLDPASLWSHDPQTGTFTQITNNADNLQDWSPAVSPDGTRVVFARTESSTYDELYVANADGTGGLAKLTDDPAMEEFAPTWSPDGRKVAFAAVPVDYFFGPEAGAWEVYTVDADGSDLTQITHNELREYNLAWSPDGTRIALGAYRPSGDPAGAQDQGVYVMDADGSDAVKIADGNYPSWSPDGLKLAHSFEGRLYTMDADGSDRREIVTDRFEDDPDIESVSDSDPSWSPDGTRIAFVRDTRFEYAIGNSVYTAKVDGSDLKLVAGYFPRALDPDWGPAPSDAAEPTVGVAAATSCGTTDRSGTMNLTVNDPDGQTQTEGLKLSATSSNTRLVPASNVTFGGSGANRTLTATALSGRTGTATLTVTVSDGTATATVAITVKVDGSGSKTTNGTAGADMIFARNGADVLNGLGSIDLLCGAAGADTLNGAAGADTLNGAEGADTMNGGLGADRFRGGKGTDTATDFNAAQGDTKVGIP
jgi:Tol biopolymer transport system component